MVSAPARRRRVVYARGRGLSERRACAAVGSAVGLALRGPIAGPGCAGADGDGELVGPMSARSGPMPQNSDWRYPALPPTRNKNGSPQGKPLIVLVANQGLEPRTKGL